MREWGVFWDTVGCLANCAVAFEAAIFGACWGVALGATGVVAPLTVEVGLALAAGGALCAVVWCGLCAACAGVAACVWLGLACLVEAVVATVAEATACSEFAEGAGVVMLGVALDVALGIALDVSCVNKLPFLLGALGNGMVRRSPLGG